MKVGNSLKSNLPSNEQYEWTSKFNYKTLDEVISKVNVIRSESNKYELIKQVEEKIENIMENIDKVAKSLNKFIRIYILLIAHELPRRWNY